MWVMTSFGILMPALRPEKYTPVWDDRTLQIRARRAKELDILRAKYMQKTLGETIYTPDKDYEYRAYCTHEAWSVAMMKMSMEIDYVKFKPTTERYADHKLHSVYNRIWAVVIGELSSKTHQDEYWHANNPPRNSRSGTYPSTSVSTKKGGRHTGTGWPDDPETKSYSLPPNPSPDDVRPRSPLFSGGGASPAASNTGVDWPDCRTEMPGGYVVDRYIGPPVSDLLYRNTQADRDYTVPEVWDAPNTSPSAGLSADALSAEDWRSVEELLDALPSKDPGAAVDPLLEGMDIVTRARLEVDELTRSLGYRVSHAQCDHGWGPPAKARCRRKQNNETIKRIEEIEALIEEVEAETRGTSPALTAG